MRDRNAVDSVLIILAVIGAIAVIGVLGMWLVAATMMGGVMGGCCGIWGAGGWLIGPLGKEPIALRFALIGLALGTLLTGIMPEFWVAWAGWAATLLAASIR